MGVVVYKNDSVAFTDIKSCMRGKAEGGWRRCRRLAGVPDGGSQAATPKTAQGGTLGQKSALLPPLPRCPATSRADALTHMLGRGSTQPSTPL